MVTFPVPVSDHETVWTSGSIIDPAGGTSRSSNSTGVVIIVIGIDIGKNSFHIVGLDDRGAMVLRQKWSRTQVETRLANVPRA